MSKEFGGKEYFFHSMKRTKKEAQKIVKMLRKEGNYARIQKVKLGYMIFTRSKSKTLYY